MLFVCQWSQGRTFTVLSNFVNCKRQDCQLSSVVEHFLWCPSGVVFKKERQHLVGDWTNLWTVTLAIANLTRWLQLKA